MLTLKPYLRANGSYDFPITINEGDVYVFSPSRYKQNCLTNSDYAVSQAYIEHLAIYGFETVITKDIIENKQNHIELLKFIQAYGDLKVETTSQEIWDKLAREYENDFLKGIA